MRKFLNFTIHHYDSLGSTNDEARIFLKKQAPEGSVICAGRQTAGRGRQGRLWVSEAGNLFFSLILRPDRPINEVAQLSFVMALAVGETIVSYLTDSSLLLYKWPNDVLLGRKKVGGILIEIDQSVYEEVYSVVAGVGVNLAISPPEMNYPVACLQNYTQKIVNRDTFLAECLQNIKRYYCIWHHEGFAPLRDMWIKRAYGFGKIINARVGKREIEGKFTNLSPEGALMIQDEKGLVHTLASAEILKENINSLFPL